MGNQRPKGAKFIREIPFCSNLCRRSENIKELRSDKRIDAAWKGDSGIGQISSVQISKEEIIRIYGH